MGLRMLGAMQGDVRHSYSHAFTGLLKIDTYEASIFHFVFVPGGEQNTGLYGFWNGCPLFWKQSQKRNLSLKRDNMA